MTRPMRACTHTHTHVHTLGYPPGGGTSCTGGPPIGVAMATTHTGPCRVFVRGDMGWDG